MMFLKRLKNKIVSLLMVSLISSLLFSCNSVKLKNSQDASIVDYNKGELMILLADEKNKYEKRYGFDVWNLKSGDGERYFSELVVQNVKKYVEKILTINKMSEKYNISISVKDQDTINLLAEEYYNNLTDGDLQYMTTTKEDVVHMYTDFHKARLTIDHVTKNANIELSISEAKVVKIQYIQLETKEDALNVASKSHVRNANFLYLARQYGSNKDDVERIVMRGDDFSMPFPEIYYMATGEISDVLENEGKYYIFKCLDDYLEEETKQRQKDILKQLKENAFNEEFLLFEKNNAIFTSSKYFDEVDYKKGEECTVNNFYDLYYKYFPM